jgi:hypothetical protein
MHAETQGIGDGASEREECARGQSANAAGDAERNAQEPIADVPAKKSNNKICMADQDSGKGEHQVDVTEKSSPGRAASCNESEGPIGCDMDVVDDIIENYIRMLEEHGQEDDFVVVSIDVDSASAPDLTRQEEKVEAGSEAEASTVGGVVLREPTSPTIVSAHIPAVDLTPSPAPVSAHIPALDLTPSPAPVRAPPTSAPGAGPELTTGPLPSAETNAVLSADGGRMALKGSQSTKSFKRTISVKQTDLEERLQKSREALKNRRAQSFKQLQVHRDSFQQAQAAKPRADAEPDTRADGEVDALAERYLHELELPGLAWV